MDAIDIFVRGACIGLLCLLGAQLWRQRWSRSCTWAGTLLLIGYAAYLLCGFPGFTSWRPPVLVAIVAISLTAPYLFWIYANLLFDDDFRPRPVFGLWLLVIEVFGLALLVLWRRTAPWVHDLLGLGFRLPALALAAHALWKVWQGRTIDLVEERARMRVTVVVTAGVACSAILLTSLIFGPIETRPPIFRLAEAMVHLAVIFALTLAVMVTGLRGLSAAQPDAPRSDQSGPPKEPDIAGVAHLVPAAEAWVVDRLASLMSCEQVWRESGLTIGDLATRVGVPEYRLRRLINQQLGYRNFVAFLNEYRLAEAAQRFSDRRHARIPILTVALDLGWGSIGPFNRAFRARFGIQPSEYRRRQLNAIPAAEGRSPIAARTDRI
jgi:AraC-like DNA-binding protein